MGLFSKKRPEVIEEKAYVPSYLDENGNRKNVVEDVVFDKSKIAKFPKLDTILSTGVKISDIPFSELMTKVSDSSLERILKIAISEKNNRKDLKGRQGNEFIFVSDKLTFKFGNSEYKLVNVVFDNLGSTSGVWKTGEEPTKISWNFIKKTPFGMEFNFESIDILKARYQLKIDSVKSLRDLISTII